MTVLVDPWLEGDLVFANQTWLYRGQKGALKDVKLDIDVIGAHVDVILLSQVRLEVAAPVTLEVVNPRRISFGVINEFAWLVSACQ